MKKESDDKSLFVHNILKLSSKRQNAYMIGIPAKSFDCELRMPIQLSRHRAKKERKKEDAYQVGMGRKRW